MINKMLEEINRDRFSAAMTWLERECEWLVPMINWDMIGVCYISLGLFVIIVGVCTDEETTASKA